MYPEDFDGLIVSSRSDFDALDPATRVAYCLHELEAEVNNGGFHQFLSNSSGEFALETLDALEKIRAPKTRRLLEKALATCFPEGYPKDPADHLTRIADFEEVSDAVEALDAQFFEYEEALDELVNEFLSEND